MIKFQNIRRSVHEQRHCHHREGGRQPEADLRSDRRAEAADQLEQDGRKCNSGRSLEM